tara:strand:+ start:114421 stop:114744 length:324 start_codon:yes stop_codon:yes gene_type:complete
LEELDFTFTAKIWIYQGKGTWHFISVPAEQSDQIKFFTSPDITGRKRRGWGSVRVKATIGDTTWQTSVFPSKSSGQYILPVKAEIRKKTKIADGDDVQVTLNIKTGL